MDAPGKFRILFTACSSREEAERIARSLVESRQAACVNIVPAVSSIYRWQGKVETAGEILLIIKTTVRMADEVEKTIGALHSYDLPEVLSVEVAGGSERYLEWLATSLQ